jgi:hypothetical protein
VLACSQTRGGRVACLIACPTTPVEKTRDSRISLRLDAVYRQLTLRPARLITASEPSSSVDQPQAWRHPMARRARAGLADAG